MITIATYNCTEQAELLRGRLEQEGIPALVADANVLALNWALTNAVGGVKVQVREEDVPRAQVFLNETQESEDALPLSPYTCPVCESTAVEFRRLTKHLLLASWCLLGIPLAWYRPRCHCLECGHTWKHSAG